MQSLTRHTENKIPSFPERPEASQYEFFPERRIPTKYRELSESVMRWPKTIELAGHTIPIILPHMMVADESRTEKMKDNWWLINPSADDVELEVDRVNALNAWKDLDNSDAIISSRLYGDVRLDDTEIDHISGYKLFKHLMFPIFQFHYPEYLHLSEKEAIDAWIYTPFPYFNPGGYAEMARLNNCRIATNGSDGNGELSDIWAAARDKVRASKQWWADPRNDIVAAYLGLVPTISFYYPWKWGHKRIHLISGMPYLDENWEVRMRALEWRLWYEPLSIESILALQYDKHREKQTEWNVPRFYNLTHWNIGNRNIAQWVMILNKHA